MTQEQTIRQMLQGFLDDPADSEYQEGFLAALCVVANEVMGIEWPLQVHDELKEATAAKARVCLTVINGGKDGA